jgi:gamma-glutamyltranspeptidase / glutathione hydrolase
MPIQPGIAAGHPATAEAGLEILAEGGTAADAAVGAGLVSCVAETVMTGLAGGGHAIFFERATCCARLLDFFVAIPGIGSERSGAPLEELEVAFGAQLVHYSVGIASCGVPGVPAGLDELWRRYGRLPWKRLVAPALRLAKSGVAMPPAHAKCLEMISPVLTMREGELIYSPGGRLLAGGDRLDQPGLVGALELIEEEGAGTFYSGTIAERLLALMDERAGLVTSDDLTSYRPRWVEPATGSFAGATVHTRAGLAGLVEALAALPPLRGASEGERAIRLCRVLVAPHDSGNTTNFTVVDSEGNACVVTTSLGLGSGDYLPGLDVHLNSMLGETDLLRGQLAPGQRMASMMAPTVVLDEDGLVLAAGSAGGTRLRSALVQVLGGILDEGLDPQAAVERPRLHPVGQLVHIEPGFAEDGVTALLAEGYEVKRWDELHHYFGGASVVGRTGAAADPRRSGLALTLASA